MWKSNVYRNFSEFWTSQEIWATIIILKNNQWEIWATLGLSPVAISQNMDVAVNSADTTSRYFQKFGTPFNNNDFYGLRVAHVF